MKIDWTPNYKALTFRFYFVNLQPKLINMLPNSTPEEHRKTCLNACSFARSKYLETEAILGGLRQPVCPLRTSWPTSCQRTCTSDADCQPARISKCCQLDACQTDSGQGLQFARTTQHLLRRQRAGVCTQVVATTEGLFVLKLVNNSISANSIPEKWRPERCRLVYLKKNMYSTIYN